MVTARWNGAVIAESDDTIVVEGNHYFPREAVNASLLRESDSHTVCPWKGTASYYTIVVDGAENPMTAVASSGCASFSSLIVNGRDSRSDGVARR